MKRMLALCLALVLLLGVMPARPAQADAVTLSVTGGWLRLRAAASFEADTISSYYTGTKVTVLGAVGAWYNVRTPDGRTGYMYGRYLSAVSTGGGGSAGSENTPAYVTSANGKGVRMRTGPGTAYGVIKLLSVGTKVTILSSGTYWHYISVNGVKGYMMAKYLTAEQVVAPSTPESTTSYTAYVTSANGKGVNLRKGPSTGYASYGLYAVGTQATVKAHTGSWSLIEINGREGYMMTQYLTTVKPSTPSVDTTTDYTAYVTSSNGKGVKLRKGPSTGYASYGTYAVGTKVTVLSNMGDWSYIDTGVRKGYMMSKYLTTQVPSGGATANYTAYVTSANGKGVYLRTGAGTGYSSLGLYSVGTQVTVLRHNTTWDYIRIGTREGYMMNQFLTTAKPDTGSYVITGVTLSSAYPYTGETLWANVSPSGANVTYEWVTDNGLLLSTAASYKLTDSDVGRMIRVRVTGKNGYTGSAVSSFAVVNKAGTGGDQPTTTLKSAFIDNGNPTVGDTLTAGVLPAGATATYSWMRNDGTQVGTAKAYTVQKSDVGYTLYVRVTGTGSYSGTVASGQTAAVKDNAPASVALSGKVELASAIMCGVTLEPKVSLNTTDVNYQWYVDGAAAGSGKSLAITESMAGKEIKLVVTPAGSGYHGQVESNVCTVLGPVATTTDL